MPRVCPSHGSTTSPFRVQDALAVWPSRRLCQKSNPVETGYDSAGHRVSIKPRKFYPQQHWQPRRSTPHLCFEYFPTSPYCASAAPRHIAPFSWKSSSREDIRPTSTCACSLGWDLAALREGVRPAIGMEFNQNTSVHDQQGVRRRHKPSTFDAAFGRSLAPARLFRVCALPPRRCRHEKTVQQTDSAFNQLPLEQNNSTFGDICTVRYPDIHRDATRLRES